MKNTDLALGLIEGESALPKVEGTNKISRKTYIGDGVYLEYNGYDLILTTEDGISVTNRIVLEPEVYTSLLKSVELMTKGNT